jgi:uncharacterized protein (DUF1330 family)
MANVPVYALINLIINDTARYRQYEKGFFPMLKKYGGELVTFDDDAFTLEGFAPRAGRMIILKFPSEAQIRAWFADPDYQALAEHRRAGTRLEFLTAVRGQPPR